MMRNGIGTISREKGIWKDLKRLGAVSVIALSLPALSGCQTMGGGAGFSFLGGGAAAAAEDQTGPENVKEALEETTEAQEAPEVVEAKATVAVPKRKPASIREAQTESGKVVVAAVQRETAPDEKSVFEKVAEAEVSVPEALKSNEGPNDKTIVGLVRTYDKYRGDLAFAAQASFENRSAIKEAHMRLAQYDPKTLSRAWVAYNASVAAQTPSYSKEVASKAGKSGPERFLNSLYRKSDAVMRLKSSPKAVRSVLYSVSEENHQMDSMSQAYRQISIDLQTGKTTNVSMAAERSKLIKAGFSGEMVVAASKTNLKVSQAAVTTKSRPILGNMLILGAHISTNTSEGKYKKNTTLLSEYKDGEQCLKWAKLNLAQCIAASRDLSEQAYCTGRHGIKEVSDCWGFMTLDGNPA
ncbi:MAG: hypothetical protein EP347_00815 [Alphaproteobacteria bacterium]|nr:MAG: hypothetical protein EP347_00815 [Alphaproteobacteria bacterium]